VAKSFVLDSSALLASLFREPGAAIVEAVLSKAAMSALNYSEVVAKLVRRGESINVAIRLIDDLSIPIVAWDEDLAREAADLSKLAWTHGLSLGDRACLATARHLNRTALTAEQSWREVPKLGVPIQVIR